MFLYSCILISLLQKKNIDVSNLQGDTNAECRYMYNIVSTVELFTKLGFHPTKSIFSPTQILVFLGFILNSITMKEKMSTANHKLSKKDKTSYCRGSPSNWPYHFQFPRGWEQDKTNALSTNAGNFNTPMRLSAVSLKELQWWIAYMYKSISYPVLSLIIHSHTSKKKWHSVFSNGNKIGGRWSSSEALKHINTLELQPRAMFGLKYFAEQKKGYISNCSWIIQLLLHYYINNMGESHSQELEEIARDLWD